MDHTIIFILVTLSLSAIAIEDQVPESESDGFAFPQDDDLINRSSSDFVEEIALRAKSSIEQHINKEMLALRFELHRIRESLQTLYKRDSILEDRIRSNQYKILKQGNEINFLNIAVNPLVNPVAFFVANTLSFSTTGSPMTYDTTQLNVGGGMDTTTGTFTAPVDGLYHFAFSGISGGSATRVTLQKNGVIMASGYSNPTYNTVSLTAALQLVAGDQVFLQLYEGVLYESASGNFDFKYHYSQFTGFLF